MDFLFFTLRECSEESLGYSPFELLYGRQIRGPLKVNKDQWFDSVPCSVCVETYIENLRSKLSNARTFAANHLLKVQNKMVKQQTKAVYHLFKPGDKVLLFLSIPGSPLKSKYIGPYKVLSPDRKKDTQMVHVNLIKPYFSGCWRKRTRKQ